MAHSSDGSFMWLFDLHTVTNAFSAPDMDYLMKMVIPQSRNNRVRREPHSGPHLFQCVKCFVHSLLQAV